jgi:hypothetical protein
MASHNGTEIRVLAASGVCGSGFRETSLEEGMRRRPHFIGCDCGSTDPAPTHSALVPQRFRGWQSNGICA